MELLETDDPVKGQLLKKSAMHRDQLEEDARLISEKTEKIITNAIVIGGALAVTYYLVNRFTSSKRKKKSKAAKIHLIHGPASESAPVATAATAEPEAPGMMTQIGAALASQATVFLLGLAKEKLSEFLEAQAAAKTKDPNERP